MAGTETGGMGPEWSGGRMDAVLTAMASAGKAVELVAALEG